MSFCVYCIFESVWLWWTVVWCCCCCWCCFERKRRKNGFELLHLHHTYKINTISLDLQWFACSKSKKNGSGRKRQPKVAAEMRVTRANSNHPISNANTYTNAVEHKQLPQKWPRDRVSEWASERDAQWKIFSFQRCKIWVAVCKQWKAHDIATAAATKRCQKLIISYSTFFLLVQSLLGTQTINDARTTESN